MMMEWHIRIQWQDADKIDWKAEAEKLIDAYRIMGDEYDVPAQAVEDFEPIPFTVFRLVNDDGVFAAVEYGNFDFGLWGAGETIADILADNLKATWDAFDKNSPEKTFDMYSLLRERCDHLLRENDRLCHDNNRLLDILHGLHGKK